MTLNFNPYDPYWFFDVDAARFMRVWPPAADELHDHTRDVARLVAEAEAILTDVRSTLSPLAPWSGDAADTNRADVTQVAGTIRAGIHALGTLRNTMTTAHAKVTTDIDADRRNYINYKLAQQKAAA